MQAVYSLLSTLCDSGEWELMAEQVQKVDSGGLGRAQWIGGMNEHSH